MDDKVRVGLMGGAGMTNIRRPAEIVSVSLADAGVHS